MCLLRDTRAACMRTDVSLHLRITKQCLKYQPTWPYPLFINNKLCLKYSTFPLFSSVEHARLLCHLNFQSKCPSWRRWFVCRGSLTLWRLWESLKLTEGWKDVSIFTHYGGTGLEHDILLCFPVNRRWREYFLYNHTWLLFRFLWWDRNFIWELF